MAPLLHRVAIISVLCFVQHPLMAVGPPWRPTTWAVKNVVWTFTHVFVLSLGSDALTRLTSSPHPLIRSVAVGYLWSLAAQGDRQSGDFCCRIYLHVYHVVGNSQMNRRNIGVCVDRLRLCALLSHSRTGIRRLKMQENWNVAIADRSRFSAVDTTLGWYLQCRICVPTLKCLAPSGFLAITYWLFLAVYSFCHCF